MSKKAGKTKKTKPIPKIEAVETLGQYLTKTLESPYSAIVGVPQDIIGHHYGIYYMGVLIAFSYITPSEEGIVVLDEMYNTEATEWAEMFKKSHPKYDQPVVHQKL